VNIFLSYIPDLVFLGGGEYFLGNSS